MNLKKKARVFFWTCIYRCMCMCMCDALNDLVIVYKVTLKPLVLLKCIVTLFSIFNGIALHSGHYFSSCSFPQHWYVALLMRKKWNQRKDSYFATDSTIDSRALHFCPTWYTNSIEYLFYLILSIWYIRHASFLLLFLLLSYLIVWIRLFYCNKLHRHKKKELWQWKFR